MTGTSMAAPMVTGAAAFLYSYRTDIALADVRRILMETARKLPGMEGKIQCGGVVNVYLSLIHILLCMKFPRILISVL